METWQIVLMFAVNLIAIIAGVSKGIAVLISVRDTVRDGLHDLRSVVGFSDPPTGLVGDVMGLKKESTALRYWSIEAASKLDMRPPGGRT